MKYNVFLCKRLTMVLGFFVLLSIFSFVILQTETVYGYDNSASVTFVKSGSTSTYDGETVTTDTTINLSWVGHNVEKCKLFEQPVLVRISKPTTVTVEIKGVAPTSSMPETMTKSMDFVLKCKGVAGSNQAGREVSDSVRVIVSSNAVQKMQTTSSKIITSFEATPSVVTKGGSTVLTWNAPNAQYCQLQKQKITWENIKNKHSRSVSDGDSYHPIMMSGGVRIDNITKNTTYRLICHWTKGAHRVNIKRVKISVTPNNAVCPADAKRCPDGSSVGRVAPDCNFAPCPGGPYSFGKCTGQWCPQQWWQLKAYKKFIRPIDIYSSKPLMEVSSEASSSGIQIIAGIPDTFYYTWKKAYYTEDGKNFTKNVTLTGDTDPSGKWIVGQAKGVIDSSSMSGSVNYIATYTCKWHEDQWKCGCNQGGECNKGSWYMSAVAHRPQVLF